MLLTTTAGPAQYAGAKAAVAKLWLLLGTGSLGTLLWYYLPTARDRTKVINSFTLALGVGFAGGFLLAHPTFLWRGEYQLRSIQFYADWVDPNLTKLSTVESWWQVTHYYFTTALPEKWLQYAFFLGVGTILWSRQPLALAFLFGAMICFIAHSVTMKLWPHHIVPWLPLLCFVAAHPLGLLFSLVTQKFRSRLSALTAVALALGLPLAALPLRLAKADEYLTISRGRTTQIEAMNRWLSSQVPADAFALPVFVRGQQQSLGALEGILELFDHLLLVLRHHVEGLEVVGGIHAQVGPLLALVGRRDLAGVVGKIPDMAHGGLHAEVLRQVPPDGFGLGRALDNDQGVRHRNAGNRFPLYRIGGRDA